MGNHFYGTAIEEHYEKDIKDFTPTDWVLSVIWLAFIAGAIVSGVMGQWGLLAICAGAAVSMIHFFIRVVMKGKSKVTGIFLALGILVIIGGVVLLLGTDNFIIYYAFFVAGTVWVAVGIICLRVVVKNSRLAREYSLIVTATCETVDVKRINLFRFDDRHEFYNDPVNDNELYKPAFHYFVNGVEYFTESTVYYGDLNSGFKDGQRVELRVNPLDPNQILPKQSGDGMFILMGVSGLILGVIWYAITTLLLVVKVF